MHPIGLLETLADFAREHQLQFEEQTHFYNFLWSAQGEERYIRIDKRHYLVDAGIKRGENYRTNTNLGYLGANGRPKENLEYYRTAANEAKR